MRRQLRIQAGAQTPEAGLVIGLNLELLSQLPIQGFDELTHLIDQPPYLWCQLHVLVALGQGLQAYFRVLAPLLRQRRADVALVADHRQVLFVLQQITRGITFIGIGTGQLKIEDGPTNGDEQMQAIAIDGLLFGWAATKGRAMRCPIGCRRRYQMKLYDWNGQTVDHTLPILSHVQSEQDHLPDVVDCTHQVAAAPIEARALRQHGKEMTIVVPFSEQVGFLIPFTALADNRKCEQLAIATLGSRTWPRVEWREQLPQVINQHVHPGHKVVKVGYHRPTSVCGWPVLQQTQPYHTGGGNVNSF